MYQDSSTPHIILWGHSLGTSIATRTLATLETQEEASMIKGLVLESPFNKMEDEVKSFSAVKWTSWLLGVVSDYFLPEQFTYIDFYHVRMLLTPSKLLTLSSKLRNISR